jgi:hypothetical protein
MPQKHSNKAQAVEGVEGTPSSKRNTEQVAAGRTQSRETTSIGLPGVREAAIKDKKARFTALMHHLTPDQLRNSFYALKRRAAPGLSGVTRQIYAEGLEDRLAVLHAAAIQRGSYRAQLSRHTYISKTDGSQRPLGIAAGNAAGKSCFTSLYGTGPWADHAAVKVLQSLHYAGFGFCAINSSFCSPCSINAYPALLHPIGAAACTENASRSASTFFAYFNVASFFAPL